MITIPLSSVVAFLQRRGVDLACLEGAPRTSFDGDLLVVTSDFLKRRGHDPERMIPAEWGLYLGTDKVCPAAMGWAAAVLAVAVGRDPADQHAIHFDGNEVDLYKLGDEDPCFWWAWRFEEERTQRRQNLIKPAPPTPAERLCAVLEYEMGRA